MWKNKTIPPKAHGSWVVWQRHIQKNEVEKHLGVCDAVHVCKCVGSMPCFTTNPVHTVLTATSGDQERHKRSHLALTCGSWDQILRRGTFEPCEQVTPLRNAKVLCIIIIFSKWISQLKQLSLNLNLNWLTDTKTHIWCNKHLNLNEQLFRQTHALILM